MEHQSNDSLLRLGTLAFAAYAGLRWITRQARRIDFRDMIVVITGGSRRLVLARQFAREEAIVIISGRDADELERARADLHSRGARVAAVQCRAARRNNQMV